MPECEQSCLDKKDCPDIGECCHSCMYFVRRGCVSVGRGTYYPRHFKRLAVG